MIKDQRRRAGNKIKKTYSYKQFTQGISTEKQCVNLI